jgi:dienelactone hydrolase
MMRRLVYFGIAAACFWPVSVQNAVAGDKEISFRTQDGWTIHGTLSLPEGEKGKVPAVILLPSEEHDRSAFGIYRFPGKYQYPGLAGVIAGKGVATLSLDLRGRGRSLGEKDQRSFSPEESSKIYLDVQGAIAFLSTQGGVDSSRIAIVAEGTSADAAVMGWDGDKRIRAMALVSGRLSDRAKKQLSSDPSLPLLLLVSSEDKKGFADMTDAYFSSKNSETDIDVYNGLGVGTGMFSVWRYKFPKEKLLHQSLGEWVSDQLLLTGELTEVSFQTEDGWTIFGNLRVPELRQGKLPAVILMHSGLSDRYVYSGLEVELAKAGLAVLNIDWRGNGKSTGKGKYFELAKQERDKAYLDAKAAVGYLANIASIDSNRIGVIGTVLGAKHAMAEAADEPRIKTAVVLTGYIPTDKERAYLTTQKPPILYVTSRGHTAVTRALQGLYNQTKDSGSELAIYDGGAIGYQLLERDDRLVRRIVTWMKERLNQ